VILLVSGATVYASQNSLPGEPLYLIKSLSEDIRVSIAASTESKLDLTLNYSSRRIGEITSMVGEGKNLPDEASERLNNELDHALLLAAQMDDRNMQDALGRIKHLAKSQGMTIKELLNMLPEQSTPAIIKLRERLEEQIELSTFGEIDPQAFRTELLKRQNQQGKPDTGENENKPDNNNEPAVSPGNGGGEGNDGNNSGDQPNSNPGHDNPSPGQFR
jgi:hypothetical protein